MSSFSNLLRSSAFASFSPKLKQVYVAPTSACASLDYGMKRTLPASKQTGAIAVTELDTKYGLTRADDAFDRVARYAFASKYLVPPPNSTASRHAPHQDMAPRAEDMSDAEWKTFLAGVRQRKQEFRKATEKFPMNRRDPQVLAEFVGLSYKTSVETEYPCTLSYLTEESGSTEAPPPRKWIVKGRVLRSTNDGYCIGIGGYTCWLDKNVINRDLTQRWNLNDKLKVYDFFVTEMRLSRDGRPHLRISLVDEDETVHAAGSLKTRAKFDLDSDSLDFDLDDLLHDKLADK